jgi:hypothetical protein
MEGEIFQCRLFIFAFILAHPALPVSQKTAPPLNIAHPLDDYAALLTTHSFFH